MLIKHQLCWQTVFCRICFEFLALLWKSREQLRRCRFLWILLPQLKHQRLEDRVQLGVPSFPPQSLSVLGKERPRTRLGLHTSWQFWSWGILRCKQLVVLRKPWDSQKELSRARRRHQGLHLDVLRWRKVIKEPTVRKEFSYLNRCTGKNCTNSPRSRSQIFSEEGKFSFGHILVRLCKSPLEQPFFSFGRSGNSPARRGRLKKRFSQSLVDELVEMLVCSAIGEVDPSGLTSSPPMLRGWFWMVEDE